MKSQILFLSICVAAVALAGTLNPIYGEEAVEISERWDLRMIEEAPIWEYLLVNYPHKPDAPPPPMGTWNPHTWSVFKQENPEKLAVILDFINYMQQPDIAMQIAAGWNEVAVRNDAANPWAPRSTRGFWLSARSARRDGTQPTASCATSIPSALPRTCGSWRQPSPASRSREYSATCHPLKPLPCPRPTCPIFPLP